MKVITVPNTAEAMKKLDFDECTSNEITEINLTEIEYGELWKSGVIDKLNQKLNLLIDDYENESIEIKEDLLMAKNICLKNNDSRIVNKLLKQVELALMKNTGVYFYF